jgi:hypothetical protein
MYCLSYACTFTSFGRLSFLLTNVIYSLSTTFKPRAQPSFRFDFLVKIESLSLYLDCCLIIVTKKNKKLTKPYFFFKTKIRILYPVYF